MTVLGRVMAYQQPFRDRVAHDGLLASAPVSVCFALVTAVVSVAWRDPAGHLAVAACCTWRATDLSHRGVLPLLGSAFLVRRPVEAAWTLAATWLVLGPLEAVVGGWRLLTIGALGHVVSTVLIDLCWLAQPGGGLAGMDVGTSAVVVTAAAALAVATRSVPVATVLVVALAVDLAAAPDMATAEHLIGVVIGAGGALLLAPRVRRHPGQPLGSPPARLEATPRRGG